LIRNRGLQNAKGDMPGLNGNFTEETLGRDLQQQKCLLTKLSDDLFWVVYRKRKV